MLWSIEGERAYAERQDVIERTGRQRAAGRAAGKFTGGTVPFGYRVIGEKYDKHLVPNPRTAHYVPEIFRGVIQGDSLSDICRWLDSQGIEAPRTGGSWASKTLSQLIKCETYCGFRKDARGNTVYRCEPLVTREDFDRANEALASRAHRGAPSTQRALLSGCLKCGKCHSPMYRIKCPSSTGEVYTYYRCAGRGRQRKGCGFMMRLEHLDACARQSLAMSRQP